jgi:hypothetical protein
MTTSTQGSPPQDKSRRSHQRARRIERCTAGSGRGPLEKDLPSRHLASGLPELQASERLPIQADPAIVPVVRIWLTSDQTSMVIHVWDASDEMPVRQEAAPGDNGGRGLMIIEALSADWGAYRKAEGGGKVVWAMITSARP